MKKGNWLKRHPILYSIIGIFLFIFILGLFPSGDKQNNIKEGQISDKSESIIETLTISCEGPAGDSFYLFTESDGYEITSEKVTCKEPFEVLERTCVEDIDEYTLEIDKVRQGDLVGWAMRKDLKCTSIYCDSSPDSICNERN